MKKLASLLVCCMMSAVLPAQIEFSIDKENVKCNFQELGSITLSVEPDYPPYTFSWSSGQTTSAISGLEPGVYTVTITDSELNDTTVSVEILELACAMSPEVAFTPNGDGYNDTWFISNAGYFPEARILVYDRQGQKVFEHEGLYNEPWEGKNRFGVMLPSSSYFYIIYPDKDDESELIKGSVTIMK